MGRTFLRNSRNFGIDGIILILAAYGNYSAVRLSDEEWRTKNPGKEKPSANFKFYIIAALIFGGLSAFAFNYQTETWHNPELIAQNVSKENVAENKTPPESKETKLAEKDEKILERAEKLNDEEKLFFYTKVQEYLLSEGEISPYEKAWEDVENFSKNKAEEKAAQEKLIAEEKARAEAERLAAEQRTVEEEKNKPRPRSAKIVADLIVNHAKSKFGIDGYLTGNSDRLFHYSAYLMMMKLDYENAKKANPNFHLDEDRDAEQRALKILNYLGAEGEVALQYWTDKRPEFIAMTAKQENTILSVTKSAAELKQLESRRDNLYRKAA